MVDDGSPDNCGKICDEYALKDARIHVIHKENGGLSDARNVGIDYAFTTNSEWITFVDSDDYVPSDTLNVFLDLVSKYGVDVAVGKFAGVTTTCKPCGTNEVKDYYLTPTEFISKRDKEFGGIYVDFAWCKLYKKELFSDVRFPVGRIFEDAFTTYKIVFKCEHIAVTNAILYYYFTNEQGITHSSWTPKKLDNVCAFK